MARPREFDPDEALSKAQQLFWAKGYEATGLRELAAETGVQVASLYAAFGDKRELYRETLRRYIDVEVSALEAALSAKGTVKEKVSRPFLALSEIAGGAERGCFLINAAAERMPECPDCRGLIAQGFARLEAAFARALSGDSRFEARAADEARALLAALMGLKLLAKSGAPRASLAAAAERALARL